MEEYYKNNLHFFLGGKKCKGGVMIETMYQEVFDIKEDMAAVRFRNGRCGIVDCKGKTLMRLPDCKLIEFVKNDFLKVTGKQDFLIDMRSKAIYTSIPDSKLFGEFELLYSNGYIYTRTRKIYEVRETTFTPCLAKNGLYLTLPCDKFPVAEDGNVAVDVERLVKDRFHAVCLLAGDNRQVYWLYRVMTDGSIIVMNDKAKFFHVTAKIMDEGKVVARKRNIGGARTSEEENALLEFVDALEQRIDSKVRQEERRKKFKEDADRQLRMTKLCDALPFKMGSKWGLKQGQHIVVPPRYHAVKSPVGKYCAVEMRPMQWGIITIDDKMVVEPRYEDINISENGTAELTIYKGKSVKLKLD